MPDVYDNAIESCILMDWESLNYQWSSWDNPLFKKCGPSDSRCGCPTLIRGCGYIAVTPEVTAAVRAMTDLPRYFDELEIPWNKADADGRRELLQPFARAQRLAHAA